MRVLITFQPNQFQDNFEGSRLRKTIKGALEMVGVDYITNSILDYDIVHLLSSDNEIREIAANKKGVPVVISALFTESDPDASYFEYKSKDGVITNTLTPKNLRFLNNADLILVPLESCKKILEDSGVIKPIKAMLPGINLSRFNFSRSDEKEIFYRFFQESKNKKIVISNGDYDNIDGINCFIQTAKKCPNAGFYYFGQAKTRIRMKSKIKKIIKKAPNNCHFSEMLPDDIYRSALLNASIFLFTSYKYIGFVSLLEAMAAKCQLILREQSLFPGFIEDGVNGYVAKFSETLASLTKDYLDGNLKSTIDAAYKVVKNNTLINVGNTLNEIYKEQILIHGGKKND